MILIKFGNIFSFRKHKDSMYTSSTKYNIGEHLLHLCFHSMLVSKKLVFKTGVNDTYIVSHNGMTDRKHKNYYKPILV